MFVCRELTFCIFCEKTGRRLRYRRILEIVQTEEYLGEVVGIEQQNQYYRYKRSPSDPADPADPLASVISKSKRQKRDLHKNGKYLQENY